MPCAAGMNRCVASCLHRRMVEDYRLARHAQEQQRDDATSMGRGEEELWRENGGQLVTFKDWLLGWGSTPHDEDY